MALQQEKSAEDRAREIWGDPSKKARVLANLEAGKDPLDGIELAPAAAAPPVPAAPTTMPQPSPMGGSGGPLRRLISDTSMRVPRMGPAPQGKAAEREKVMQGAQFKKDLAAGNIDVPDPQTEAQMWALKRVVPTAIQFAPMFGGPGRSLALMAGEWAASDLAAQGADVAFGNTDRINFASPIFSAATAPVYGAFQRRLSGIAKAPGGGLVQSLDPRWESLAMRAARTGTAGAMGAVAGGVHGTASAMADPEISTPDAIAAGFSGDAITRNTLMAMGMHGGGEFYRHAGRQAAMRPVYQPAAQVPTKPTAPARTSQQSRLELSKLRDGTELLAADGSRVILRRSVQPKTGAANVYLEYPDGTREPLIDKGVAKKGLDSFAAKIGTDFQPLEGPQLPPPPAAAPPAKAAAAAVPPVPPAETFATPPVAPSARITRQRGKPPKTSAAVATADAIRQQKVNDQLATLRKRLDKAADKATFLAEARKKAKKGSPYSAALDVLDAEVKTAAGVTPPLQAAPSQPPASPTAPVAAFKQGDAVSYTGRSGEVTGRIIGPRTDKGYYPVELTGSTGKTSTTTRHESLLRPAAPKKNAPQPQEGEVVSFAEAPAAPAPQPQAQVPPAPPVAEPGAPAGIPMMITAKMRIDLKTKGFTDAQINAMKPADAWVALNTTSGASVSDAVKEIKKAAEKQNVNPAKIFAAFNKKAGGGAHPQPPTPKPGEPRSRLQRLMGNRGVLNLGLTQAELEATAPRRPKAPESDVISWNDAVDTVHQFKKAEGGNLRDFMKMFKENVDTPTYQRNYHQLYSAWKVLSKAPAGGRRLEAKEAKTRVEPEAEEKPVAFDAEHSRLMVAPPTEVADFNTGEVKPKAAKKAAPPDVAAAEAREKVTRGDYRDYNAWREQGLEHSQAVEATLEQARDRYVRDTFNRTTLENFRKLVGKPGSKAVYNKTEGRRTVYDQDLALDEGDIEGSTARIMRERGIEQADADRGAKETVAFGKRGARGTKAGTSQYETFKENVEAEGGMIEHRRSGSRTFWHRKPVADMSPEEAAAAKREEDFMDRMWAQVLEQGSDAKGRGVPHRPAPLLAGAEREAAMRGTPEAEARERVPARPPAKTFKRPLRQLGLKNIPGGTAEVSIQQEPPVKERPLYRPAEPKIVKKYTGAKTSKGAPIFESRPLLEGKPAPDREGVKLIPAPKRLPTPEKFETIISKTSKGERVFEETTKKGDVLSTTPLRRANKEGILTERPTSEFRRPKPAIRGVLPVERSRMPAKAPKDRPFITTTKPAPSEPMKSRGEVRSEIHPIGGAGYRASTTSTGKNLRSRMSDTSDLTVKQGSTAPFKVREKSGLTPSMRDRLDARELERDLKDLQRGGPRGGRRYERASTQMSMTGELESAGGVRQLAREMGKIELSDAEMAAARKAYDRMAEARLGAERLAAIARNKENSPSLRIAALQRLREVQSAKLQQNKERKLTASVQQRRDARLVAAEAQIRGYLGEGRDYLLPKQAANISRQYKLSPEQLADLTNKVRAERTLGPAKEAKGLPSPPDSPPSGGGRPPLFQRLLHDDSGVIGGRAAQQSIQQRRAEKVAKRQAYLRSKNAPFDAELEANRAAVEEQDPSTFLNRRDRASKKLLDRFIAYEVATKRTGQEFPKGSSPLEWVHAIAGGGDGKATAAAIRLHDIEAPHWKRIPRSEWDVADQAVDYALAYEQIAHSERILQDRVNEARKIYANAVQIGVVKDITAARNLLKYEKAALKNLITNGVGVKGAKLTPAMARARMQALMAQAPPSHKALINDVLNQTRAEFEKSLDFRVDPDVQMITPATKQQWVTRGAYQGGLYRLKEAGASTGRAMIEVMRSRGKLTVDEANALRRFMGFGDEPVITGRDSVYRTLFRDYRDAERAKLVNKIVKWFGNFPEYMQRAPKDSAPTPANFMPVYAWENGTPVKYFLHQDLAEPIMGVSLLEAQLAGLNNTIIRKINTWSARAGTSLSPAWQVVTNPQRDVKAKRMGTFTPEGQRAFPMTPQNALKDFTIDYVKNFSKVAKHHPEYLEMLEHYGGQSGLVGSLAPDFILEGVMKRNPKTGALGPSTRGSSIKTAAARLGHTFENTPKVSGYTQLVKLGVDKDTAGIIARQWSGTADLSVHGEYGPAMQVGALYLNANMQEKRRWARDIGELLHNGSAKSKSVALRRIAYAIVGTTASALANGAYNNQFRDKDGNPELSHVPPEILEQNWVWMTPATTTDVHGDTRFIYVKSPKETPQQVVAPLVFGLLGYSIKGDHEGAQRYAEEWFNAIFPGRAKADFSSPGAVAKTVAQGLWSNAAPWYRVPANLMTNTEMESGRAIVPKKMVEDNRSPELRYTAYTNQSTVARAKQLAEYGIHVSPKQIEYIAKSGLGAPGSIIMDADEMLSQWGGKYKSPSSADPFQKTKRIPVLGVMAGRLLGPGNVDGAELRDTDTFYSKLDEARRFQADYKAWQMEKANNPAATPSVFLRSEAGKFWAQGKISDTMLKLAQDKGALLAKSAALLERFKAPKTTDAEREKILQQMAGLRKAEQNLLKAFKQNILKEKPTIPPPPNTGFTAPFDLRNRQK